MHFDTLKKKKNATLATGWVYRVFQRGGMATIFLQFLLREFRCAKTKAIHLLCSGQHSVEQDRFFFLVLLHAVKSLARSLGFLRHNRTPQFLMPQCGTLGIGLTS